MFAFIFTIYKAGFTAVYTIYETLQYFHGKLSHGINFYDW